MKRLIDFLREEEGSNAIEYGLIAALIGLAIIVAAGGVGDSLNNLFGRASTELDAVPGP